MNTVDKRLTKREVCLLLHFSIFASLCSPFISAYSKKMTTTTITKRMHPCVNIVHDCQMSERGQRKSCEGGERVNACESDKESTIHDVT